MVHNATSCLYVLFRLEQQVTTAQRNIKAGSKMDRLVSNKLRLLG